MEDTTDKIRPVVEIELDGTVYKLEYGMWAVSQLKALTGKNIIVEPINHEDPNHMTALLWAGLIKHHPELDGMIIDGKPNQQIVDGLRKVGNMLSIPRMLEIGALIAKAKKVASPKPSEKGTTPKN